MGLRITTKSWSTSTIWAFLQNRRVLLAPVLTTTLHDYDEKRKKLVKQQTLQKSPMRNLKKTAIVCLGRKNTIQKTKLRKVLRKTIASLCKVLYVLAQTKVLYSRLALIKYVCSAWYESIYISLFKRTEKALNHI